MNKNIVVVGDVIIDEYTYGTPLGLSAETPTIVSKQTNVERFVGGAGFVVRNLLRLGCKVTFITCTENRHVFHAEFVESMDGLTREEAQRLKMIEIPVDGWKTTQKRRFFSGPYKIAQFDIRNEQRHTKDTERKILDSTLASARAYCADLVLVSDYRHGVISQELAAALPLSIQGYGVPVWVDSQASQEPSNHLWYKYANRVFMNQREFKDVSESLMLTPDIPSNNTELMKVFRNVVLKLGDKGAVSLEEGGSCYSHSGYKVDTVDTCGAGDAFFAAYAAFNDLAFANYWAALSTTYKGTIVPPKPEMKDDETPAFPRHGQHL